MIPAARSPVKRFNFVVINENVLTMYCNLNTLLNAVDPKVGAVLG
jgi:hypothetical protein